MKQIMLLSMVLPVLAFIVSVVLTAAVRRLAPKAGFCAYPRQDRYHRSVIAMGGGIAIFWTLALFLAGGAAAVKWLIAPGWLSGLDASLTVHAAGFLSKADQLLVVVAVALGLHILGLWDDRRRLGPYVKLILQFALALAAAGLADIRVEFFIHNKIITTLLSAVWIVLLMNVFNFLDNMDGASAGMALIIAGVLFTAAAMSGQVFVGAMGLVLIGTLAGFLVFNFPPATIFMGDAGSLVVGFFMAVLSLKTTYYHQSQGGQLFGVFMPLAAMAVPLYDFATVTFLRLRQGKSPLVGDTQHFSHRLRRRGLTDVQVALTLYLATLCTGLGAVLLLNAGTVGAVIIFTQTTMVLGVVAILEATGKPNE